MNKNLVIFIQDQLKFQKKEDKIFGHDEAKKDKKLFEFVKLFL